MHSRVISIKEMDERVQTARRDRMENISKGWTGEYGGRKKLDEQDLQGIDES